MDQLERLAHPSSVLQPAGVVPARGTNRGWLTVVLTVVSLVVGAAGAGIAGWKWFSAEQHLALNQAGHFDLDAATNALLKEFNANPDSHPRLRDELKKLDKDLTYIPSFGTLSVYEQVAFAELAQRIATPALERRKIAAERVDAENSARDHLASVRNHDQDVAKKVQETEVVSAQAKIAKGVVTPPLVNALSRAASFGVSGDPSPLTAPGFDSRRQGAGSMPIGRSFSPPFDPYKNDSNIGATRADDPWKNTSTLGKE